MLRRHDYDVEDIGMVLVSSHEPLTIELVGEFDTSNTDQLRALLTGINDSSDVVVDTPEVTFASAALLSCLIELSLRLGSAGHDVQLRQPSRALHRLLLLTDTTELFTFGTPTRPRPT